MSAGLVVAPQFERRGLRRALVPAVLDALTVVVFVALGRDTHDEGVTVAGTAETAAPFLISAALGWMLWRAWRTPLLPRTGALVAGTTIAGGLVLRRLVFDDGTAFTFVLVATLFLGGAMIGWRRLAGRVMPRIPNRATGPPGRA